MALLLPGELTDLLRLIGFVWDESGARFDQSRETSSRKEFDAEHQTNARLLLLAALDAATERFGCIGARRPPLSEDLKNDLWQWAAIFDSWLDVSDPANSPAVPDDAELRFERAGIELWRRVADELGSQYRVRYHSQRYNREFAHESELPEEVR